MSKKQLLILFVLCISTFGFAQSVGDTFVDNFITYEITSLSPNEVEAKDYSTSGGTIVTISDNVIHLGQTFNITSISVLAFSDKNLTEVVIGNNVVSISNAAFFDNQINSLTIGTSVANIGLGAFQSNNLTNVVIPDSVTSMGNQVFAQNDLTDVTIGTGLTVLPQLTFLSNNFTSFTVPDHIINIEARAFDGNSSLTNLTLGTGVSVIGDWAFRFSPLTCIISEATMPPAITTGGNNTFDDTSTINLTIPTGTASDYALANWTGFNSVAEGLTGTFVIDNITYQINATPNDEVTVANYNTAGGTVVNIPETVTRACTSFTVTDIADFSLDNINLTSLTLPNSLVNIGENAFAFNDLPSIIIPDSVEIIGDGAFAQNNNMTSVTIGSSVINIGEYSFRFNALTSLTIPDNVITIGQLAFSSNSITNLDLGNGVETIGSQAFRYNNGIQSLTIPASVTSIGDSAFLNITSLTDVYAEGNTPPTITTSASASDSFAADRSNIHLHIPPGTMGVYVTDVGALWTGFNPVSEDALSIDDFELSNTTKIITSEDRIQVISNNNVQLQHYEVYTLTGAKVTEGYTYDISTETWAKGIYILKLDFDRGTVSKKVIIN